MEGEEKVSQNVYRNWGKDRKTHKNKCHLNKSSSFVFSKYLPELLRLPVASQYKSEPRDPSTMRSPKSSSYTTNTGDNSVQEDVAVWCNDQRQRKNPEQRHRIYTTAAATRIQRGINNHSTKRVDKQQAASQQPKTGEEIGIKYIVWRAFCVQGLGNHFSVDQSTRALQGVYKVCQITDRKKHNKTIHRLEFVQENRKQQNTHFVII